ncbi:uncharacterized protein V2V93DRAFT_373261 [Kockiozyma suomiensis]|uniref:uncharacterized protein n=1 Tax=Kockiozyma suomiensis TaxID=1337062 RepID=UPI0033436EC1
MDLAELSNDCLRRYIEHADSVNTTLLRDSESKLRNREIQALCLQQGKVSAEDANVMLKLQIRNIKKELQSTTSKMQQTISQISQDLQESKTEARNLTLRNTETFVRLEQTEKKLLAATQRAQDLSNKLLEDSNEIEMGMEKAQETQNVLLEQKYKYKELLEEKLRIESEFNKYKYEMKNTNETANAKEKSKSTKDKAALGEKLHQVMATAKSTEDNLNERNSELRSRIRELESKCRNLEMQQQMTKKDSARNVGADVADNSELGKIEKKHKEEMDVFKVQLAVQKSVAEKAEKETEKLRTQLSATQKKLDALQNKIKTNSTTAAKRGSKAVTVEARPATALLFTPEPERVAQQKRGNQANARGKAVEKSTFSMTPFLARQASTAPLSPLDVNSASPNLTKGRQEADKKVKRRVIGAKILKPTNEGQEKSSEVAVSASDKLPDTGIVVESTKASDSTVADKQTERATTASLAALVAEELSNPSIAAQKKKKRKLGSTRPTTLFDESQEEAETATQKRTKVISGGMSKVTALTSQRLTAGKTISPLKKRNENLRDMFKL